MEVFQSPAELPTCSHLFPATPCAGFLGRRRGGGFAFFTALFLSCSVRLHHSVFAKAKIQNILGKAAGGGDAAQIPTSLPGVSPSTIWQCRLPRHWRSGGLKAHGPAPAAAGFIPVAPRGAEGDRSLG